MYSTADKIKGAENKIKELESSLLAAYDCKTPNVYSNYLELQIQILNDVLVLYAKTNLEYKKAPENELIYNIESEL